MKNIFILLLSSICLFANIGTVVDVVGNSTLTREGKNISVLPKLELREHDFIKTGKNAKVKIFFSDNTAVSLGQNTTFEIDSYLFTGKKDSNIKFKVLKGFFKTVTGKIGKVAPNKFKLQTKNATIGIRGTVFAADVGDEADVVMCTDGRIILFTPSGDVEVNAGAKSFVKQSQTPQVKQYSEQEKKELIKNAGWHGSMSLSELREFINKNFKEPLRSQLLATVQNIYDKDSSEKTGSKITIKNADDISFVDDITINDREFDELPREIEFYTEDLKDGKVIVQGILESEDKAVKVESLHVEITTDGGDTWTRAKGHEEWEWSYTPELEKEYEFSLRVVHEEIGSQDGYYANSEEPEDVPVSLLDTITIAGFKLTLNADASLVSGKLSGSGSIEIPYLSSVSNMANKIDVNFEDLSVVDNIVTLGDITYNNAFSISTPIANVNIDSITFSPIVANNKLVGKVVFKDQLASSFGEIALPSTSKFLPTSFALNIPFESKIINIWREKSVQIEIAEGSLDVKYNVGDTLPTADLNIPSAMFKFGELLTYEGGIPAQVGLGDFGKTPTIELPNEVFLLQTGITIPSGLSIGFDLNDYTNPKLTFSSSVNLDGFTNEFAQNLENASIDVTVLKTGFEGTLTGDGGLDSITIIDRGSETNDVKLVFDGDRPVLEFKFTNGDDMVDFSISGVTPKLHFGDMLTNEAGQALNKIVSLGDITAPTLNIAEPMYLLGSKIKLPNGFNASVNLSDMKAPVFNFDIGVDFTSFDDNIIAKQISGAKIKGTLSKEGFNATVTSDKPNPIDIYEPNAVKIVFNGESGPSFGISISGSEALPEFSISNIDADLDFGTLLTSTNAEVQSVVASLGVIRENGIEALQLTLPSKVKLLQSNLAFEHIVSKLNLTTKQISINSSIDLSAYTENPILKALNGSKFDMRINPSAFSGTIYVEDELEPIDIWAQKRVSLNITGKPTIGVNVDSGGVGFDFGKLSASIDFGDLLTTARNSATSVVATFSQAVNEAGNYSVKLEDEVYLLGSKFALDKPQIDFNPNIKSITLGSGVNLKAYTIPMIKAFDGAEFIASVSSTGFSGSLSKEGGFEPIVVLERGGVGKDVSVEFTTSPTVSVEIKNSGVDFGFNGGNADIHFGDLLNNATASLAGLENGMYSWELLGKNKLYNETKAYISDIRKAKLDIKDFTNPKIFFDASLDLSEYKGIFSDIKAAELRNVEISKEGFKASLSASLGTVDIWKEKRVTMAFSSDPTINLSIDKNGFGLGFSEISGDLNFGDLLNDATASIGSVMPSGGISSSTLLQYGKQSASGAVEKAKDTGKEVLGEAISSSGYNWTISRNNLALFGTDILLSDLGGSIDLSDFSNPSITFNATADMRRYGAVFKYVREAELENVTISKEGFSGSLITSLENIPIWREKNVEIAFDKSPKFYLNIDNSGLKVGASNINASVHLGDLLNDSVATLRSLEDDVYSWSIDGKNKLGETSVYLSKLKGAINFADLKDPTLFISSAKVEGFTSQFQSVTLKNAKISKDGFDAYLSAEIDDINLYTEDIKKVDLRFEDGKTPTLHLQLTRSNTKIGLSDLSADLTFTNMLNNSVLKLKDIADSCSYDWGLNGSHNFLNDDNGVVVVSNIGGQIDLCDWSDPIVNFHTVADFTNYNFSDNLNLGIADVTNAEITKTSINWNVTVDNARADFTILEMGDGANDDVRVELRNVSGSASNSGGSVDGADGTLFLGKLFSGNKEIGLSLQTGDSGLKTYGFSFNENIVYRKDDNNFVTLIEPSGQVIEIADGVYKVRFTGQAEAKSSVLSAISIGRLTASNLEVSSTGFKGDIAASFDNINKTILEGKASISLRGVGFHIDSSLDMPIKLSSFDGGLDLQYFFDEDVANAILSFVADTSSINWTFPTTLHVNDNFEFKGLSGTLSLGSLDTPSIGLDGIFGYKGISQEITLNGFTIGGSGIDGSVEWNGNVNIFSKLDIKHIDVLFAGVDTEGSLGLLYSNASFLSTGSPLNLGLNAVIDKDGIQEFEVDGELSEINVLNFAKFTFTNLTVSPKLDDFWVKLDGTVKPNHSVFSSEVGLEFKKLKISSTGIELASMEASADTSGSNADLGFLSVGVEELALGYDADDEIFYIYVHGGISLDIIGKATAGIKIRSDKKVTVDDLSIKIEQSGLTTEGTISWYDGDETYGDGFDATLGLGIAGIFTADGKFRIGQKGSTFYWMANANGGIGGGVTFGALTIYEVGGGIAYNMLYDVTKEDFIPRGGALSLMLSTTLGTSGDSGYLWNGKITLKAGFVDGTLQQINLDGYSWLLANRGVEPDDREISAHMTYGKSPSMLHVWVNADVKYMGITVKGSLDAVISDAEKHVFIGTDDEYAYAFNVDKDLGHVSVGIFGIEGRGFFMVDTNAIAFGESLYIYKHWKKSWFGPDPSLTFKLTAGAKALLIYNPFQMNMDIFAEVGLRGCYGGCVSVGADVLVKVALPNPDYVWGRARVSIFGKSMSFSGFIKNPNDYSSSDLQPATETPDLEIFDRLEVPKVEDGIRASRIPLMKVYSKFQRSQEAISISVENVRLLEIPGEAEVELNEYFLEGDWKSYSFMPKLKLKKNQGYKFIGTMKATYEADDETEVEERIFKETFRTTSSDRVEFSDIVKSITPINGDKDVHEDKGVKVTYNRIALTMLGLTNAQGAHEVEEVKEYKIYLNDADGNNIVGAFSNPDANLVSKFIPIKDLRIYRYCKNEEGDIRETFTLNGVYLNPFNEFSEDDGMEELPSQAVETTGASKYDMNVNAANINPVVADGQTMQNILRAAQEASSGNRSVTTIGGSTATPRALEIARVVPTDLRLGNLTLRKPAEALGEEITSTFSRGKSYTYYRASTYNIKVMHKPSNTVAYTSSFDIRYNNIPAESKRKVEEMSGNLKPTLTVSLDMMRLGAGGNLNFGSAPSGTIGVGALGAGLAINLNAEAARRNAQALGAGGASYNGGFNNEVRYRIVDTLVDIGVYSGIKRKVFVTWELQKSDGSVEDVREELASLHNASRKLLPGVVRGYKDASIQFFSEIDDSFLVEIPMDLITGDSFCAVCEQQEDRENREAISAAADRVRDSSGGRMGDIIDGFRIGAGSMDGGFSHEGGGFNPMDEGAFENMKFDALGSMGAQRTQALGAGTQAMGTRTQVVGAQAVEVDAVQGVDANMHNVGR